MHSAFLLLANTAATELPPPAASPYALPATFAGVMLLTALVLVVFMRPGGMARIVAGVPFSLFILTLLSILTEAGAGVRLVDFNLAEAPSPTLSTLRLAAELLCFLAAWKCVPWLYVGKESFISLCVRLLTRR